jgi:hypothetical protein
MKEWSMVDGKPDGCWLFRMFHEPYPWPISHVFRGLMQDGEWEMQDGSRLLA